MAAIEPPPAPIAAMSTCVARTGMFHSMSVCAVFSGSPSQISDTSVDVPPMSSVTMLGVCSRRPRRAAPCTPAAGPDIARRTGSRAAVGGVISRPSDRTIRSGPATPADTSVSSTRSRYCCTSGDTRALIAVVLVRSYSWICGSSSDEIETGTPGSSSATISATRRSCARLEEAEQERDGDRLDAVLAEGARNVPGLGLVERAQDLALRSDALVDLEPQRARDQRHRAFPVVAEQMLAPEATQLERVAKSARAEECRAREPALDQRVGDDGGAVPNLAEPLILRRSAATQNPARRPSCSWPGTVGTFPSVTVPDATSRATRSVNVPPMSTPTIAELRSSCGTPATLARPLHLLESQVPAL